MNNKRRGRSDLERAMHCDDVTRLVWLFLDDELTPRGSASIRVHLRECASCRAFVRFECAFLDAVHAALRGDRGARTD
jgi:predicted anti-sigma-YlaC factor YlaD